MNLAIFVVIVISFMLWTHVIRNCSYDGCDLFRITEAQLLAVICAYGTTWLGEKLGWWQVGALVVGIIVLVAILLTSIIIGHCADWASTEPDDDEEEEEPESNPRPIIGD